jgi:predicted Zn-dependent peptidase
MNIDLARYDSSIRQTTLANGLRVLHIPRSGDSKLHVTTVFATGVRYESLELAGISHFLEHSMFRGSRRFPSSAALAEAFEWLGGEWNAATGTEHTEFWYTGTTRNRSSALDLFAEFIIHPTLTNVDTERQIILRELQGELNEAGVSTDPTWHLADLVWPGTSFALPILGTPESIERIDHAALERHRLSFYRPDNAVVCVVGDKDSDGVFRDVDTFFGKMPAGKGPLMRPQPLTSWTGPAAAQRENPDNEYQLQIAFIGEGLYSPKATEYDLVARILGDGFSSRLARRIREELGIVYDISSDASLYQDVGTLNISTAVSDADLDEFCVELAKITRDLADKGPTQDELARCKERALVDLELIPADPATSAFRVAWNTLCKRPVALGPVAEKIRAATTESVRQVCAELLRPERFAAIALGPKKSGIEQRILRTLG